MQTSLTIGFSPCPNDTFIFEALVNNRINNEDIDFQVAMEDIETLNEWALAGKLDITKMSFPTLFQVLGTYRVLHSGSALGQGCGPMLVAKKNILPEDIVHSRVAIPGINTTANMLLSFAFPGIANRIPMVFSQIEDAVLQDKADLGLIIHESRFTYEQKGLHKVADLGEYWEKKTDSPIPLACIAIKRNIPHTIQMKVDRLIRQSLDYAFAHYPPLPPFVTSHAQEMDEQVMQQHIGLYVNDYSLELGVKGQEAIRALMHHFPDQIPGNEEVMFV